MFLSYLTSWTFFYNTNDSLSGQANQNVRAVVIQRHIIAIECDHTQV